MNALTVHAVIAILTFGVFSAVNLGGFVDYGDARLIRSNVWVQTGLEADSVVHAFEVSPGDPWQPLAWLSLQAQVDASGLASARPFLFGNLALHIAAALLLLHALTRMTGRLWPSAFVAAVFALHPVQVETVAWASARPVALTGLFVAAALALWAHYVDRPSAACYALVVVAVVLGVLSGGSLVALPFVLVLLDLWPLGRLELFGRRSGRLADRPAPGAGRLLGEKAPLLAIALVGTWAGRVAESGVSNSWGVDPGIGERLGLVLVNVFEALGRILWPTELTFTVPNHVQMGLGPVPLWQVALALTALVAVTAGLVRLGDRARPVLVGWLWFVVATIPAAGLVPSGLRMLNDRFLQLAVAGVALAAGFGAAELLARRPRKEIAAGVLAGLVLVPCAVVSREQVGVWHDSDRLFDRALAVNDRDAMALYYKGLGLARGGYTSAARANFERALEIYPDHVHAGLALGQLSMSENEPAEALLAFEHVRAVDPDSVLVRISMANALMELGRSEDAMVAVGEAIEIDPRSAAAWRARARVHVELGDGEAAVVDYDRALALEPDDRVTRGERDRLRRALDEASSS